MARRTPTRLTRDNLSADEERARHDAGLSFSPKQVDEWLAARKLTAQVAAAWPAVGLPFERAYAVSPQVVWVLRASMIAENYDRHQEWEKIEDGWFWPRES